MNKLVTTSVVLSAIAAISAVSSVNAAISDESSPEISSGVSHQLKCSQVKNAVSQQIESLVSGMVVDGVDLDKVYAGKVNGQINHQAGGAELNGVSATWCHNQHGDHRNHW